MWSAAPRPQAPSASPPAGSTTAHSTAAARRLNPSRMRAYPRRVFRLPVGRPVRPAVGLVGRAPGAGLLGGAHAGAAAATPVVTESADSAASSTASPEPVSTVAEAPAALAR